MMMMNLLRTKYRRVPFISDEGASACVCVCVRGHMTIGHADHRPKCDEPSLIILTISQLRSRANARKVPH